MNTTGPLRVGVIGLGYFGERHARIYRQLPHAELVAVCDVDGTRAKIVGDQLGATPLTRRGRSARAHGHRRRQHLPARPPAHRRGGCGRRGRQGDPAREAARPRLHACQRIVAAVERAGVRFMVGHILRFDPRYVQVYEASRAGDGSAGRIHLRAKRNGTRATARRLGSASSILFYMGVHDVDAMQWIARSPIVRVYAQKISVLGTRQRGRALRRRQFRERRDRPDRLQLGLARRADERLSGGARGRRERAAASPGLSPTRVSPWSTTTGTTGGDTHLWPEINGRIVGDLADEIAHFVERGADRRALRPALSGGARRHPGPRCPCTISQRPTNR